MANGLQAGVKRVLTTVVIFLVALNVLLYFRQPAMVYYPYARIETTPKDWGLAYQEVELQTDDGVKLHGWFIPNDKTDKVVLFFHGNAGNISHRRDSIEIFRRMGLSVFIFDYRGYGRSAGRPSETGTYRDARAAWRYLTETRKIRPEKIILFGRSLGGAVAAKLATEVRPAGLIIESTFSSARDMANRIMPVIAYALWLRYDYNTVANVRKVTVPLLVIHSKDDDIIPYRFGRKIFAAANPPKTFVKINGDHNSGFIVSNRQYSEGLEKFIGSLSVN